MGAVINVCGLQRSGTTMLHLMLATGPNAVACGEIAGWFRIARYRGEDLPPKFRALQGVSAESFHKEALDHFDVDFIIDSSKGIDWVIDTTQWAHRNDLKVFNILIWKDPVDLAYSKWKRNRFRSWKRHYIRYHKRLFNSGIDFVSVNYRSLVSGPSDTLARLCQHTGMDYFDGKELFWKEDHEFTASSEGVRRQVQEGHSRFQIDPFPSEFEPFTEEVESDIRSSKNLRNVLQNLEEREISNLPIPQEVTSHRYHAQGFRHVKNKLWRAVKLPLLRMRWNVLQQYIVDPWKRVTS